MANEDKEVRFDKWCPKCEHEKESEFDVKSPCFDCLYEPSNRFSTKPVNYKEKKENGKS